MRRVLFFPCFVLLISCTESKVKISSTSTEIDRGTSTRENKIPTNIDDDFNVFLSYFNKDSIFQISRIVFPIKVQELELKDSSEMVEKVYYKKDHRNLDFTVKKFDSNIDNYTQHIRIEKNKATIEIRGVDNGIIMDFFFEKRGGKWMLTSWTDSST